MSSHDGRSRRSPLTRQRIVEAAVDVADREGLDALTMRRLGSELGVEAMSLYKHVANKDEIVDGIVDHVLGQIELPGEGSGWREGMRRRAISAREVLGRHSWAVGLMERRRSMGPAVVRYLDAILGTLRSSGFSVDDAVHAFWLLDSFIYGQVVQEASLTLDPAASVDGPESALGRMAVSDHPHLLELAARVADADADYSMEREFEFGLDLILDALERTIVTET